MPFRFAAPLCERLTAGAVPGIGLVFQTRLRGAAKRSQGDQTSINTPLCRRPILKAAQRLPERGVSCACPRPFSKSLTEMEMLMTTVNQLLKAKGRGVVSIAAEETVYAAISLMAEFDIGSLVVMDGRAFAGMLSERDYVRNVRLKGRTSLETRVGEVMETRVPCVEPNVTVEACLEIMTRHRVRHLPVLESGRLVGIVSIGDLIKSIIDEQKFTIDQLEGYIHGEPLLH